MVKLVLFDIDGTLIRSGGAGVKAFGRAMETIFKIPNATAGVSFAGRTDTGLVRELFLRHRIPHTEENCREFFECYVFWLDRLLNELDGRPCPGAFEMVEDFQRLPLPPRLGLLTGNIRLGAEIKMRYFGLWDYFVTGAFGDDHEDRNQLAVVAQKRGNELLERELTGDQILVIGDTPADVKCAQAINARCLAVATGGSTVEELKQHQPTWAVPDLQRVRAWEICG